MDEKLARGHARRAFEILIERDPSKILDHVVEQLTDRHRSGRLAVAARKAFVRQLKHENHRMRRFTLLRHRADRLRKSDLIIGLYPTIGSLEHNGVTERFITFAGSKIEIGEKRSTLNMASDTVIVSEHALARFFERAGLAEMTTGALLDLFLDALWPGLSLSLIILKISESTALPPVAALPVRHGLLLGARSRIAEGIPQGFVYHMDAAGGSASHPVNSVLSRNGEHYYLNFRTFVGVREIAPAQQRVHDELLRFTAETSFPIEELFLALLFNDPAVADPKLMNQRYRWRQLEPLLAAFAKKDWASVVPKPLREALGIDGLVSDS